MMLWLSLLKNKAMTLNPTKRDVSRQGGFAAHTIREEPHYILKDDKVMNVILSLEQAHVVARWLNATLYGIEVIDRERTVQP